MSRVILDGKFCAQELKLKLALYLERTRAQNPNLRAPGLAVIQVGDDSASDIYIKHKQDACQQVGIKSFHYHFPATISQAELKDFILSLNSDASIDAVLCQLPLPTHLSARELIAVISPQKDADGFHPLNLGRNLMQEGGIQACTPGGIRHLLKKYELSLEGKHALIINRSLIVGKPLLPLLLQENMTVTVAHSKSEDLVSLCKQADLVVVAVGKPYFLKPNWVKEGSILIDVGIHRLPNGNLAGDIHPDTYLKASAYTPVPGGVGPMTVACLLENTVQLYRRHFSLD